MSAMDGKICLHPSTTILIGLFCSILFYAKCKVSNDHIKCKNLREYVAHYLTIRTDSCNAKLLGKLKFLIPNG